MLMHEKTCDPYSKYDLIYHELSDNSHEVPSFQQCSPFIMLCLGSIETDGVII